MASSATQVKKKAYCKKAVFQHDSNTVNPLSLQSILSSALSGRPKAKDRRETQGSANDHYRLINNFSTVGGALCGLMVTYTKDANALTLAEDDNAEVYDIEQLAPPKNDDGKRREFLDGLLYFAIQGNVIALVQSQALRSREFEEHLFWLLNTSRPSLGVDTLFAMKDAFSEEVEKHIRENHVKSFTVGAPLVVAEDAQGRMLPKKLRQANYSLGGFGLDVVKAALGGLPRGLKFNDALGQNIELSLTIKYLRSIGDSGQKFLDNLAMAFRHYENRDTILTLNDGSEVSGDNLKLTRMLKVSSLNDVILPDSAFAALSNWLYELISSGEVKP